MNTNTKAFGLVRLLPLVALFATTSIVANAQAIGKVSSVKPQAEANGRTLSPGGAMFSQETVRTGASGVANLRFHDKSNLSVGPKSSVRLDWSVYDPDRSVVAFVLQITRGSFRFATGSRGEYQIKTPYGAIGVRG